MPFKRPTFSEIDKRIFLDIASRLSGPVSRAKQLLRSTVLRQAKTVVGVLSRAYAGACHLLYGFLDYLAKQRFVHSMDDEFLDAEGQALGLPRKVYEYSQGIVEIHGEDGGAAPIGTIYRHENGLQYAVVTTEPVEDGIAELTVETEARGKMAESPAGTMLHLAEKISGIEETAVVVGDGLTAGVYIEPDDEYRQRILDRKREPPHGGAKHDYEQWAKQVPGVTRAWCLPMWMGPGTVGVMFVRDHDADLIPTEAQCAAVQAYIDYRRPVTAEVFIFPPVRYPVDATVKLDPNDALTRTAVQAEYDDFILREGKPEGIIHVSRLSEAISAAAGEHHHYLIEPVNDIVIPKNAVPVPGRLTFIGDIEESE